MNKITFINQKGGIGKTTISTNVAREIASRGFKTVFLDCDVQANASYALQTFNSKFNVYELMTKQLNESEIFEISKLFKDNLLLIQSHNNIAQLDNCDLAATCKNFKQNLAKLGELCDYIIIDTPPTLSNNMICLLHASQYVVIPFELEKFSLLGIKSLLTTIINLRKPNENLNLDSNTDLKVLGLLVNKFNSKPRHKKELANIQNEFGELLFSNYVKIRDSIAESQELHISLKELYKQKKSSSIRKAIDDFNALTTEILTKIRAK